MACLSAGVLESQEVVGNLWWPGNLSSTGQTQHEQVQHQAIVLHDEGRKLQPSDQPIGIGVGHVLIGNHNVVLGCDVVCNVVIQNQPQKPARQKLSQVALTYLVICAQSDIIRRAKLIMLHRTNVVTKSMTKV